MTTVKARSYGPDVASYQSENTAYYGGKFALVKLTEGTNYTNPKAKNQIKSAIKAGMLTMGYFYAHHSNSASVAVVDAKSAIEQAKALGLPKGTYIADDFVAGSGNVVKGDNTNAVLAAMQTIKDAGYKPLIYSSAYIFRNNLNVKKLNSKFKNSIWVASYPYKNAVNSADFNYFPSMDGVAIWQFTDNWKGLNVDGNISLIELKDDGKSTAKKNSKSSGWVKKSGTFVLGQALEIHEGPHIDSPAIARLKKGDVIKYDATLQGPLRLWLRQPRSNGKCGYIVAKDKYGKLLGKLK